MRFIRFTFWPVLMACLLAGCATQSKTKINWHDRVGNYTYDQSVQESGVPDKNAKLGDGAVVAEWLMRSDSQKAIANGGGVYLAQPGWVAPEVVAVYPPGPDRASGSALSLLRMDNCAIGNVTNGRGKRGDSNHLPPQRLAALGAKTI